MRKQPPIIEWHIAENEAEWAVLQERATPTTSQPKRHWWLSVLVPLLLVSVGGWLWRGDQADPAPIHQTQANQMQMPAIVWGAQERLTTAHFVFYFHQRDAQAVSAVAPRLDHFYTTLQRDFGIAAEITPLVISLSTTRTVDSAPYRPRIFATISAPSPALYPATTWSEEELLTQSLALLLIDHALAQVVRRHAIGAARYPLLDGLRLWQLWETDLPLARWRSDLMRWIYLDLPATAPEATLPLPQNYGSFCAAHTLWMAHPAQIRIPLLCTSLDESPARLPRNLVQHAPRQLPRLDTPVYPDEEVDAQGKTSPARHPGNAIAVATLVDYVSKRYGRDRLPLFVAALGRYATWAELTPALFGLSAAEFEADWQQALDCSTQNMNNCQLTIVN